MTIPKKVQTVLDSMRSSGQSEAKGMLEVIDGALEGFDDSEPVETFLSAIAEEFMGWGVELRIQCKRAGEIKTRLEYLRSQLEAECISYDELHELQSLAEHIDADDVQLLEAAGVPEFPED